MNLNSGLSKKNEVDLDIAPSDETPLVSFCQLLRQVQIQSGKRLGYDLSPSEEPIKLRTELTAQFPVNELAHWHEQKRELEASFFGLFGPCGALPQHYTQKMIEQAGINDFSLRDFLDMFNHRLLSFFYRAWEKHHFAASFETASATGNEDTVTKALWALIGERFLDENLATVSTASDIQATAIEGQEFNDEQSSDERVSTDSQVNSTQQRRQRDRLHIPNTTFLYFAGHFSNRRPTADGLRLTLQHTFGMQTQIAQFIGQWMFLREADQSRLEAFELGSSFGNYLGIDTFLGSRIWDSENKFRIRFGPLDWTFFQRLRPTKPLLRKVGDFARRYVGPQYDFDVQVVVKAEAVKGVQLSEEQTALLGWNTWLGEWPFAHDADDSIFELSDFEPL